MNAALIEIIEHRFCSGGEENCAERSSGCYLQSS